MLFVLGSRLLFKVSITLEILRQASMQHKQLSRQLWPELTVKRIRAIRFHQSSKHSHKEILVIYPFSLQDKLKLIKDTFNAEIVYDV